MPTMRVCGFECPASSTGLEHFRPKGGVPGSNPGQAANPAFKSGKQEGHTAPKSLDRGDVREFSERDKRQGSRGNSGALIVTGTPPLKPAVGE